MAQFTLPDRNVTTEMRYQMGYTLADLATEFPKIVALDADLRSSTGLHIFEHFHPGKLVKSGIAEQNLVSMAAGLSQEGYIPFPCTFDAFSRRMLDQLYVTVAYSNLNVKFIGAYVGLFTGKAGATHQSDKELGTLLRVPRLTVLEPSCNAEMRQVMRAAVETPGPVYLRIVRCEVADDLIGSDYRFQVGKGVTVSDEGSDVGLVTTGFMLHTALAAADKLQGAGHRGAGGPPPQPQALRPRPRLRPGRQGGDDDHAGEPLHQRRAPLAGGGGPRGTRHRQARGRHRHRSRRLHPHRSRQRPAVALQGLLGRCRRHGRELLAAGD